MTDDSQRPIIVKKVKKAAHAAHGGAWKIAYADFVTAMMAFFLLMWLLGSNTKAQLQGIAEYFKTPLKVALQGGAGSGDSSSVIKGGGTDLTRATGQVKRGTLPKERRTINLRAAKDLLERQEMLRLKGLKARLEKAIESNPVLRKYRKQMLLDITSEGLRIQIVDEQNRPMFDSGGAALKPYTDEILHAIGHVLNEVPNRISLSGHTDATPYSGGQKGYSNWELSTDRANASRRALIAGGMQGDKVMRVVGLASAIPFDKKNPFSPTNRRISIIVMNKKAEATINKQSGGSVEVRDRQQVTKETLNGGNGQGGAAEAKKGPPATQGAPSGSNGQP
jgi:chemotaxis protein MotB